MYLPLLPVLNEFKIENSQKILDSYSTFQEFLESFDKNCESYDDILKTLKMAESIESQAKIQIEIFLQKLGDVNLVLEKIKTIKEIARKIRLSQEKAKKNYKSIKIDFYLEEYKKITNHDKLIEILKNNFNGKTEEKLDFVHIKNLEFLDSQKKHMEDYGEKFKLEIVLICNTNFFENEYIKVFLDSVENDAELISIKKTEV